MVIGYILAIIIPFAVFIYVIERYYHLSWKKALAVYGTYIGFSIVIGIMVVIPIRVFLFQSFVVAGSGMAPHLNQGDYLVIQKLDRDFKRDDIVVFRYQADGTYLIKRIVGLPGENVVVRNGELAINGSAFSDPYSTGRITGTASTTLGAQEYFVLGDNIGASLDSRYIGPVMRSQVVGSVIADWGKI